MFLEFASTSLNAAMSDEGELRFLLIVYRLKDCGMRLDILAVLAPIGSELKTYYPERD